MVENLVAGRRLLMILVLHAVMVRLTLVVENLVAGRKHMIRPGVHVAMVR